MPLTNEEFREEYKPLHVPAKFDLADSKENKLIYALAKLGEASADEVLVELEKLEPGIKDDHLQTFVKTVLADLYDKGKLSGNEKDGVIYYNLHKITRQNSGSTHPNH